MKNSNEVAKLLNVLLAQSIDASFQAKYAHWNVRGAHFYTYHKLFDEIFENLTKQHDQLAERISGLESHVNSTLQQITKNSTLPIFPQNLAKDLEFVEKLSETLGTFSDNIKTDMEKINDLRDKVTGDMLSMIALDIDKYIWFLKAHLEKPI